MRKSRTRNAKKHKGTRRLSLSKKEYQRVLVWPTRQLCALLMRLTLPLEFQT